MLKLCDIKKTYTVGDLETKALKGVNMEFGKSEFVAILGPSGCGKTTLLNIIGGLDQYTSGDLIINGTSTKEYRSSDWDTYRNHSVGFVFQSYQLIPHQTVLANVELTMTLSGIKKSERKRRAIEALTAIGLGNEIKKKPNQMSGGQMQRVAIARALVNNPEILLADEPTGALDTETSVQIMNLLKEVSKDRLVIMVTHNPELAEQYATRIIRLKDGEVISDTKKEDVAENEGTAKKEGVAENGIADDKSETISEGPTEKRKKPAKKAMSFFTALSLSLNNLLTKKGRTILTSFAGAIGIIGIALILAASTGVQKYIDKVESDTLSQYPIQIQRESVDFSEMMASMVKDGDKEEEPSKIEVIRSNNLMTRLITSMVKEKTTNDMRAFKIFAETDEELKKYIQSVEYSYSTVLNAYKVNEDQTVKRVNPSTVMSDMGMQQGTGGLSLMNSGSDVWTKLPKNREMTEKMYNVLDGRLPEAYDEVVLCVSKRGRISDYALYALGILDSEDLKKMMQDAMSGKELPPVEDTTYTFEELKNLNFSVLPNYAYYEKQENGFYKDQSEDEMYVQKVVRSEGIPVKVVGIVTPSDTGVAETSNFGGILYPAELMDALIEKINASEAVKDQKEQKDTDIFTGISFEPEEKEPLTMETLMAYIETLPAEQKAGMLGMIQSMKSQGMTDEAIAASFDKQLNKKTDATYDGNLRILGVADPEDPSEIRLYPTDFETKEEVIKILDRYSASLPEGEELKYTDYVGLIMSSVTTIINVITYVLIGFVAVSLLVSSIMIGIITYISVMERTREIGILRSIGASKRDIARVFNAETLIIGFVSGIIGVAIPYFVSMIVNSIVYKAFDIENIMQLTIPSAIVLILISMLLTLIGGLIPSRIAANKDPVEALRTE